jgi:hypothetical protein
MKKIMLVLAGTFLFLSFTPRPGIASSATVAASQKDDPSIKTFTGTVLKQGDLFILSAKAEKTNYQLIGGQDQKMSEFEGKQVKVTGTYDAENLTIHVKTIQEIA